MASNPSSKRSLDSLRLHYIGLREETRSAREPWNCYKASHLLTLNVLHTRGNGFESRNRLVQKDEEKVSFFGGRNKSVLCPIPKN